MKMQDICFLLQGVAKMQDI